MSDTSTYSSDIMSELSFSDTGDETQKRYRYQHTATAYVALLMYMGKLPYTELLCEHHEDILAKLNNDKLVGIQIKTQDPKFGFFDLKTESLIKSLVRFIRLDHDYPNIFDSFAFVSNCEPLEDETGNSPLRLRKQSELWVANNDWYVNPKLDKKQVSSSRGESGEFHPNYGSSINSI